MVNLQHQQLRELGSIFLYSLISRVIQLDACGAPPARFAAPASARHGPRAGAPLTQRDVEGEGGVFWYAGLAGDFAA